MLRWDQVFVGRTGRNGGTNPDYQQTAHSIPRLADARTAFERRAAGSLFRRPAGARLSVWVGGTDEVKGWRRVLELAENPDGLCH